jgi:acetate kinase
MKILVLNRGSSSIKWCLYAFSKFPDRYEEPLFEKISEESGLENLPSLMLDHEIDCIGHRIVHGGDKYATSVFIDSDVKGDIRNLADLAPLHNLADLEGIEALEKLFPGKPQIAVFDTAFHHALPEAAKIYPGPYEWVEMGIRRYGFHGTSFQYCTRRAQEMLGQTPHRMVICHLGSGASLCAVKEGKSIDTTMGFTPLEGLMMDTRSGTIDPGILLYLSKHKKVEDLSAELYEKSGLLGLSGISSDMRVILKKVQEGDLRAKMTLDVYVHRLLALIGSMIASLGGIDTLVFTAGIGENTPLIRQRVCDQLSFLGINLTKQGSQPREDAILSSASSKVNVLVIHTREAFEIARECWIKMQ